ncbi:hypothetical protein [Azospirillum sp.]|uniref:hypothetical protein n=1 Tax=Azospirillum sp. TaxID=34012 RepID=UPI003D726909
MTQALRPFADDAAATQIGDLSIENGTDKVAVYGSLDITRDKQGLEHARRLKDLLDAVVHALEAEKNLPDSVPPPEAPDTVENPFA